VSRVLLSPVPHQAFPRPHALPLRSGYFLAFARSLSESGRPVALSGPGVRQRSDAVDVNCGQFVWRRLKDVALVMRLDELSPISGRPAGGRHRRRFERFAHVGEDLAEGPRFRDEYNESDVAATTGGTGVEAARPPAP
jgi:hypothetical protein